MAKEIPDNNLCEEDSLKQKIISSYKKASKTIQSTSDSLGMGLTTIPRSYALLFGIMYMSVQGCTKVQGVDGDRVGGTVTNILDKDCINGPDYLASTYVLGFDGNYIENPEIEVLEGGLEVHDFNAELFEKGKIYTANNNDPRFKLDNGDIEKIISVDNQTIDSLKIYIPQGGAQTEIRLVYTDADNNVKKFPLGLGCAEQTGYDVDVDILTCRQDGDDIIIEGSLLVEGAEADGFINDLSFEILGEQIDANATLTIDGQIVGEETEIDVAYAPHVHRELRLPNAASSGQNFSQALFHLEYDKDLPFVAPEKQVVDYPLGDDVDCLELCTFDLDAYEFKSFHDGCRGRITLNVKECDITGPIDLHISPGTQDVKFIFYYANGGNKTYLESKEDTDPPIISEDIDRMVIERDASPGNAITIGSEKTITVSTISGALIATETIAFTGN